MWLPRFALNQNFLTPQLTEDGKPYGPKRYEELVRECYLISKHINTPYNEILDITPAERGMLMKNIYDDVKRQNDKLEEIKAQQKKK